MRQSGILAAAGIHALEHHRSRLADDHRRAKTLARGAGEIPGIGVEEPDTNIVMLDFLDPGLSLDQVLAALAESGVMLVRFGPRRLRAVTHMDIDDEGIGLALEVLGRAVG